MTGKALHEIEEIFVAHMSPATYQMGVLGICELPVQTTEIIGKVGEMLIEDPDFGKMIVSGQISAVIVRPGYVTLMYTTPVSFHREGRSLIILGVKREAYKDAGPWTLLVPGAGYDNDEYPEVQSFRLRG